MRILVFSLFFFILNNLLFAEDYRRSIDWQTINSSEVPALNKNPEKFIGAVYFQGNQLPFWFESFDVDAPATQVKITETNFELISDSTFILPDSIGSELKSVSTIGISAGKSILKVTIFPYIKKDGQNYRLLSFKISTASQSLGLKSAKTLFPWKTSSVLASGKWVKVKARNKGIYKITYDQLKQWGFTLPENVGIYNNGGYMLAPLNRDLKADDLLPLPVMKGKDNAGKDCLFFYCTGTTRVAENSSTGKLFHQQNFYSNDVYFYLSDISAPLLIGKAAEITASADRAVNTFPNYTFHEKESVNLISSGSKWFGEKMSQNGSLKIDFNLENPNLNQSAVIQISTAGRSSSSSSINVNIDNKPAGRIDFQAVNVSDLTNIYASDRNINFTQVLGSKTFSVRLDYAAGNSSSEAWLDYISINFESQLSMQGDVFLFRGKGAAGAAFTSEFTLAGSSAETKIWNVTNLNQMFEVPVIYSGSQSKFKSNSAILDEYVAFNPAGSIPGVDWVANVSNQNLHADDGAEMIIVAAPKFLTQAQQLADYHLATDQMNVKVVTPELIYNEFSCGLPDPSGIRNYFRMCYEKELQTGQSALKYALLFGDGTFDNRNIQGKNLNLIPTYQSDNSLVPTDSYVTDDFFAILDEIESMTSGIIDLGIGRIPSNTVDDAKTVVDKIKNYRLKSSMGNWRNVVTFIGDDEDYNTHMDQAENLANYVNAAHPVYFTDKIYFDAFKQYSTSGGEQYPDVANAISSRVKQGTLVMNYTGHANEHFLADEKVLDVGIINSWTNYNKLPIFVTATCEFSRFDANETSAGESILFNPSGGGIGLFSTTRLVYSGANYVLNSKFFNYIFEKDTNGKNLRLGDVMREAKAKANTGINQLNFTLLADPALRLSCPTYQVKTSSINGSNASLKADTVGVLSVVTIKGFVADENGNQLTTFNGQIVPTVYDKEMEVKTLGNGSENPMSYTVQSNIIYRGLAKVTNGNFEFSFFVPKDISYKVGKGKISYYAYNETLDANGYFDNFYIGGASSQTITDSKGPDLNLFMNSESFQDGGEVSASSVLIVLIGDDTGINTSGTGIGHDITAILDGDQSNTMILNDYYQADLDSYKSGRIIFPLNDLAEGTHTIRVKVWDVLNNSSEKEISFVVKDDFRIESVRCYPNPMQTETNIVFTHNQPDESFTVNLEVYQSNGHKIAQIQKSIGSQGTNSQPLQWIPSSSGIRLVPGVYIYRVEAITKDGKKASASGRLVYVYK